MIKRFIIRGVSKKFKGVQKLKAQKAPTKFTAVASDKATQSAQRKVLGDVPEFMGLSSRATGELAAESLALKTMNKKFFRTLPKEISRSRFRTARGIKNIQLKTKVPKLKVFKAKSKGAMKAYGIATTKSEKVFRSTMEKFTGKTKASSFAKRSKKVKKATTALHDSREIQHIKKVKKEWGF